MKKLLVSLALVAVMLVGWLGMASQAMANNTLEASKYINEDQSQTQTPVPLPSPLPSPKV